MIQHRFTGSSCKKGFRTADTLNQHCAAKAHGSFICPGCRQRFGSAPALQQHQDTKGHRPAPPVLSPDNIRGYSEHRTSPSPLHLRGLRGDFRWAGSVPAASICHGAYVTPRPYQRGDTGRWYALGRQFLGARARQQYFERGLQLERRYVPYAWFGIGYALRQRKDFEGTLRAFLNAADLAPYAYRTWVNLAQVFAKLGRIDEAIDACHHALAIDPGRNSRLPAFLDKLKQIQDASPPPRIVVHPTPAPPALVGSEGNQCPVCSGPLCTRVLELGMRLIEVRSCAQCGFKERS